MKARTILALLPLALAAVCGVSTAGAVTYDASADWSSVSNPSGVWRSGSTATLGSALVLHPQYFPNSTLTVDSWNSPNGSAFERNDGAATVVTILPGQASLHPGSGNQYSVLRFTAPSAGSYTIVAQFFAGNFGDTDANILLNSNTAAPLFFAATTNTNPSYNATPTLQAGDTVDFVVGSKGSYSGDTTPIQITITSPLNSVTALRTSASYNIPTEVTDAGGQRAASASYFSDGSIGGVVGISTVAAPAETAKHGYLGQITDVTGLTLTAATLNVNETATDQLAAWQLLDDATFLAVPATSVAWSVPGGPLTGISISGLATAGTVYQNTAATAQGVYLGATGTLGLTVLDSIADNYGSYAGDGVGDDWQVQYFGLNNPNAGPLLDPDGDGQANLFEFTAGLVPTDPASRFSLTIQPVPGQSGQKKLIFSPLVAGRTYTVTSKPSLATGSYLPLTNPSAPSDSGAQRTITDLSATGATKFYRVEITKP